MKINFFAPSVFLLAAFVASLDAATLVNISTSGTLTSDVDLSAAGTTNWAAWDTDSGAVASIAPTFTKDGGSGTISSIIPFGGGNARGTSSLGSYDDVFTWTQSDEAGNQAAPGDGILTGVFNSTLDSENRGVQFTLTDLAALSGGQTYQIDVYATVFRGRGEFNATVDATTVTQQGYPVVYGNAEKNTEFFTVGYNPVDTGDILTLSYELADDFSGGETSSHVAIQAVSVSVIPEPSSLALLAGAAMLFVGACRRRSLKS